MKQNSLEEKDACAIVGIVNKRGRSTHANITKAIDALRQMGHRSGDIHGEGDGCGISTDIPRAIWSSRLVQAGLRPQVVESANFFVGHFFIPKAFRSQAPEIIERVRNIGALRDVELLCELKGAMREMELGPRARMEAPLFWQIGGIIAKENGQPAGRRLFALQLELEREIPEIHIASLSLDTVVFKLQGIPELLPRVYPELLDEKMSSVITLGHGRYSTNTLPSVVLAQPFSILCHNGEINTVDRLRDTGRALGIELLHGASDSQDLNRVAEGLINYCGMNIMEALEVLFPAIDSEVRRYVPDLQEMYTFYRWFFPASAQGPAAVIARHGDCCLGCVDALGLRPLWLVESDYDYLLSSEKGVVDIKQTIADSRPLAPGEKIAIVSGRGRQAEILDHRKFQLRLQQLQEAGKGWMKYSQACHTFDQLRAIGKKKVGQLPAMPWNTEPADDPQLSASKEVQRAAKLGAYGWQQYDLRIREQVAIQGREVIGSLGHTGPLAALMPEALPNIADYFKENVAVVTNPAIDRERESEHFSTRVILGRRPSTVNNEKQELLGLDLETPLLFGGYDRQQTVERKWRTVAGNFGTSLLEDVLCFFSDQWRHPGRICFMDATFGLGNSLPSVLQNLHEQARQAIEKGAVLLVLDDSQSFANQRVYIDPALAVASLHEFLIRTGIRRQASIIIRSAAIRNLHDIMIMLGLGADSLNPYLLWQVAVGFAGEEHSWSEMIANTMVVLQKGMEKVMSTMGIHEVGGYGRIFSSIGLATELADVFRTSGFCSSDKAGLTFNELQEMGKLRYDRATSHEEAQIFREPDRNPKVGRILRQTATGRIGYLEMSRALEEIEQEMPIAIRHLIDLQKDTSQHRLAIDEVDISIGSHAMPLIIAAMSFGSQGENSFRTYARAAQKANIICINGEGGEIPDMLGRFRRNRGQQIASGRFGVSMEFLNSTDYLEIKIGQGAKPGEGGHLPGNKVTGMVAEARHCKAGTTLISPANHHDIYSIEDLAQIVTELKTANPLARISVKIPVTSGAGTIAVGIAKAGAHIVNLSGFEGGTGAAREHAKRHVGLPVEIGVSEAHQALLAAGLRSEVEIWADGGIRSGKDILKLVLLGANRVGLGTVALMGIGCISCRRCHLDRCPRGISTQIRTKVQAEARGVKGFQPRDINIEAENLARLLNAIGDEIRFHLAEMNENNLQKLVGRRDLLRQTKMTDRLDVRQLLMMPVSYPQPGESARPWVIHKPLNYLTKLIADVTMERFGQGENSVHFAEEHVRSTDRALGTYLAGAMVREPNTRSGHKAVLQFGGSIPGNGLFAFNTAGVEGVVEGGSQDGAAKGSAGGFLAVLKGRNLLGRRVDGSTGKSFGYGATGGLFLIQNMADSRACIRMSGAEVVFGARITAPVDDHQGNIASRAHLKGFAFEYMTGGRVVVLGDPGPWLCAGMTGGVIYQCLYPEFKFDRQAVSLRLAQSAQVRIRQVSQTGLADIRRLLGRYIAELEKTFQFMEAEAVSAILRQAAKRFVMIAPLPLRPPSDE